MIGVDDLTRELSRMCPLDAGERMDAHWDAANRFAAAELVRRLRTKAEAPPVSGRRHELAWLMVKEGRRLRNEYLSKVA